MIARFAKDLSEIIMRDERTVLVLSGIRQFSFRKILGEFPMRAFDMGIMEQNAAGFAAGLAAEGFIPFLHTWAPFLIERAFDQIRLFGSQDFCGNFVGSGSSYELADFGESHYCPEDVVLLRQVRNMQIVVPGTPDEFSSLFKSTYDNGHPTYYRLSQRHNKTSVPVAFGKAAVLSKGNKGTVLVVGSAMAHLEERLAGRDVTILYYTTVVPFDSETLIRNLSGDRLLICEPYNESAVLPDVIHAVGACGMKMRLMGMRTDMYCHLGKFEDNLKEFGLDEETVGKNLDWVMGECGYK